MVAKSFTLQKSARLDDAEDEVTVAVTKDPVEGIRAMAAAVLAPLVRHQEGPHSPAKEGGVDVVEAARPLGRHGYSPGSDGSVGRGRHQNTLVLRLQEVQAPNGVTVAS